MYLHRNEFEVRCLNGLHKRAIGGHSYLNGTGGEGHEIRGHVDQVTRLSIPVDLHRVVGSAIIDGHQLASHCMGEEGEEVNSGQLDEYIVWPGIVIADT